MSSNEVNGIFFLVVSVPLACAFVASGALSTYRHLKNRNRGDQ